MNIKIHHNSTNNNNPRVAEASRGLRAACIHFLSPFSPLQGTPRNSRLNGYTTGRTLHRTRRPRGRPHRPPAAGDGDAGVRAGAAAGRWPPQLRPGGRTG